MTLKSQIYTVLEESYPTPVHYKDVTQALIDTGAWAELPKTPSNTVSNTLTTEINHKLANSIFERFGEKGTGLYTINPLTREPEPQEGFLRRFTSWFARKA